MVSRAVIARLERLIAWLDRRAGCFELDGPVVIRHGSAWLRIAPGEQSGWYRSEAEAPVCLTREERE
jgi:hypothetical protein